VKPLQGLHQGGPCEEAPQVLADVLQRGRPGWMDVESPMVEKSPMG